jgi:hypothetical protein
MKRRSFFAAAVSAGLSRPSAAAPAAPAILELTWFRMRNSADNQSQRTRDFLARHYAPALRRAGSGPVGLFTVSIGEDSPSILVLTSYKNLAGMGMAGERLAADAALSKAMQEYDGLPGLGYQRMEKALLDGFPTMPGIEAPPSDPDRAARLFEMRTYESNSFTTLARKVKMFDDGEIAIFRRLGMRPVFFGRTMVGPRMPNLVYMLAYDSLAARDQAWSAFGGDPEWQKLRALPGLSDAEIVSNISNTILRPLAGSDIR